MTSNDSRRRPSINLHGDTFTVKMEIVERRAQIAVRITRHAATILTTALGAILTGLWTLYQIVGVFR